MARILAIEDEDAIRSNICEILELEGFETAGEENGLKGIQAIHDFQPDLVICDIIMPELDGFEVLKQIRHDTNYSTLPFIFLSAKTSTESIDLGLELGANAYLTKPFDSEELLEAVRQVLS